MSNDDVIVIGAGHNGLTAAALLAKAGRRVIVLERCDRVGGLAVGDEFHPGFTTVGLFHDACALRSEVIETLGLVSHGLALAPAPPPVFAPGDGPGLLLDHDPSRAAAEIGAVCLADAQRYHEYRAFIERIRAVTNRLLDHEPPVVVGPATSLWSLASHGLAMRRLGRRDMMELLRIGPMCVADWLNEWFETEWLSCLLAAPAMLGTSAGPWSPGTVANLLRHETMAGAAAQGGPIAVIDALAAAARSYGVDTRLAADVAKIQLTGEAVTGVELVDGETIDAAIVVATIDPKQTFLSRLPAGAITPKLKHHIDKLRASGATAKVDLALRGDLRFACRPGLEIEHARIVGERLDDMERAFDAVKYGRCSEAPFLDIYIPTVARPELAPDGHCVVSIVAHFAPHDLRVGWSDAERERFGDVVVGILARHAPDLAERIVARRVMTPVDIERRYGVTGGHIHHAEHALDQMIVRPAPECARYETPIAGLYLGGSGSHPGGGLTGGPGMLAAQAVLGKT